MIGTEYVGEMWHPDETGFMMLFYDGYDPPGMAITHSDLTGKPKSIQSGSWNGQQRSIVSLAMGMRCRLFL